MESIRDIFEEIQGTKRKSMIHLDKMSPIQFIKLLGFIRKDIRGIFSNETISVTEKMDGQAWRMGVTPSGVFFTESGKGVPKMNAKDWGDPLFKKLHKKLEEMKDFQYFLRTNFPDGVKIIGELFNIKFGKKQDNKITFAGIDYDMSLLGDDASIIVYGIEDTQGSNLGDGYIRELKTISDKSIRFEDALMNYKEFSVELEVSEFLSGLGKSEDELIKLLRQRKLPQEKAIVVDLITKFQKSFAERLYVQFPEGKFGHKKDGKRVKEGVVININGRSVKITSQEFKTYIKSQWN